MVEVPGYHTQLTRSITKWPPLGSGDIDPSLARLGDLHTQPSRTLLGLCQCSIWTSMPWPTTHMSESDDDWLKLCLHFLLKIKQKGR